MQLINLRVESVINPIGVDEKRPTFSWQIKGTEKDIFQKTYRVLVSLDKDFKNNIVWDSKTVVSSKTYDVIYSGKPLLPDTRYYFKVISEVNEKTIESDVSMFSTGLLNGKMPGKWVAVDKNLNNIPEAGVYVRKKFNSSNVEYATLFIYSYGWYEAYMNGKKLDDRIFTTAKTKYKKILYYDAYDVTDLISSGDNALSLILGDGYNSNANKYMGIWRGGKRFIASLNIHHTDGSVEQILSDDSWKFTLDTPLLVNNIYNGEFYDATREIENWQSPIFDDSEWKNLYCISVNDNPKFYCNIGPFVKIIEEIKPKKIYSMNDGRYIVDFGQNLAGFVKFKLKKKKGERIRIVTAEELCVFDGERFIDTITNRAAASTDTYIFKGDTEETHYPMFNYHGFRYAEISGLDKAPVDDEILGCVVHTDFEKISEFKTDNKLINRIYLNALWSVRSNSYSFPSDCPSRDERTSCPMDLYTYLNTAMYLFKPNNYYIRNFKNDIIKLKKRIKGRYDMTWCGCMQVMPLYFYKYFGNSSVIKQYYKQLKANQDEYISQFEDLKKRENELFGDWCAPNEPGNYLTSFSSSAETEQYMMYVTCKAISEMAIILGKNDDAKKYKEYAEKAGAEYKKRFYSSKKKMFSNGKQAPNVYALNSEFLTDKEYDLIGKNLVKTIKDNGYHLDVGIFGIRNFIEALSDSGEIDIALDCFMNPEYPSFANQISKGATTLWEQWCGYGDMASHNHAMFAGAVSGFFTRLAGVTPKDIAFKTVVIKPILSKHINKLSTNFETVNGNIKIKYDKTNGNFRLNVTIPPNSNGEIILPNGEIHLVGNGKYEFICKKEGLL